MNEFLDNEFLHVPRAPPKGPVGATRPLRPPEVLRTQAGTPRTQARVGKEHQNKGKTDRWCARAPHGKGEAKAPLPWQNMNPNRFNGPQRGAGRGKSDHRKGTKAKPRHASHPVGNERGATHRPRAG